MYPLGQFKEILQKFAIDFFLCFFFSDYYQSDLKHRSRNSQKEV
jgi:hypothetical protein